MTRHDKTIITGDFNSKHEDFGHDTSDISGRTLVHITNQYKYTKLNDNEPTYTNDKTGKQDVKDLIFSSPKMTHTFKEFWVDEDLGSDHNTIIATFSHKGIAYIKPTKEIFIYHKADWQLINNNIENTMKHQPLNHNSSTNEINNYITKLTETYTSYAKGAPQDTHFKFLHGTHQTNWYLQKILRDRPNTSPACNACGKTESLAHAFFECEEAYKIWREIKPKLSEILDGKNIQCFKLALKIFPPETTLAEKKMLTTIVQIAMHQIWLNRNFRKHERLKQNTQSSLDSIDRTFCKNIKRYFDMYSAEGNLQLFRQRFCQTPSICRVEEGGQLHVNIR